MASLTNDKRAAGETVIFIARLLSEIGMLSQWFVKGGIQIWHDCISVYLLLIITS